MLTVLLGFITQDQIDPRKTLILTSILLLTALPIEIWAWAGLYRSGVRSEEQGRGLLGRVSRVAGFVGYLVIFGTAAAAAILAATMGVWAAEAFGDDSAVLQYEGDTLRIDGRLTWGTTDQVASHLHEKPTRRLIVTSSGGNLGAALVLASYLREHGVLQLTVDGLCASACTALFESAPQRQLISGSAVSGHSPRLDWPSPDALVERSRELLAASYQRAGIDPAWSQRVLETPGDREYRAPVEQLVRWGVVHDVVEIQQGAAERASISK